VQRAILARHGESEYSAVGRLNGDVAVSVRLTERGRAEARRLGETLRAEEIDLCVTSAFQRTRETADEALRGRDVARLVRPELNDPLYGPYEGVRIEDYRTWASTSPSSASPGPGGESRLAIVARYARALRSLLGRPEPTILVVCHSLAISYVLAAREGTPPAARVPFAGHAIPHPFTEVELEAATELLEAWVAAPTW
jgi:broad specificity phosphatase PhoE